MVFFDIISLEIYHSIADFVLPDYHMDKQLMMPLLSVINEKCSPEKRERHSLKKRLII